MWTIVSIIIAGAVGAFLIPSLWEDFIGVVTDEVEKRIKTRDQCRNMVSESRDENGRE